MNYFTRDEFDCQETGENEMSTEFLNMLDILREEANFPFVITSGYRSPNHSIEAKKAKAGTHAQGIAADIRVNSGAERMVIIKAALALGFTGIGVAETFVHLDIRKTTPVIWIY
tara:strand:+ start:1006 stop:1347 length:342 start_codon:yes stop_codon:yes gene_type:complete